MFDRSALARVIAVANDKGGVLKTSIAANVAGELAAKGWRVLFQNLDRQSDANLDFGLPASEDDRGQSVQNALMFPEAGNTFKVVRNLRPNLDYICGGRGIEYLSSANARQYVERYLELLSRLVIEGEYHVVILDCPPGLVDIIDLALAAARYVIIPVKADQASLDGLFTIGEHVTLARRDNPDLAYLGVILAGHNRTATKVERDIVQRVSAAPELVMFDTRIPHSEAAAYYARQRGQLIRELAQDVADTKTQRLAELTAARRARSSHDALPPVSQVTVKAAGQLAVMYEALAKEVAQRMITAEKGAAQ